MTLRLRPLELAALDSIGVDAYALFVGADERPLQGLGGLLDWRLAGGLSEHLKAARLAGTPSESFLTTTGGVLPGRRIFAFGLGSIAQTHNTFATEARRAVAALLKAQVTSLAIGLPEQPPVPVAAKLLVSALEPLKGIDVSIFGPLIELTQALPELTNRG
jgi:hypothetical protein